MTTKWINEFKNLKVFFFISTALRQMACSAGGPIELGDMYEFVCMYMYERAITALLESEQDNKQHAYMLLLFPKIPSLCTRSIAYILVVQLKLVFKCGLKWTYSFVCSFVHSSIRGFFLTKYTL